MPVGNARGTSRGPSTLPRRLAREPGHAQRRDLRLLQALRHSPTVRPRPRRARLPRGRGEDPRLLEGARASSRRPSRAETRATGPSKGTFVFYEGPPTANGMPHNGHVLTRAVKDVFPRFQTMRGFDVPRKAGWDTHGLPVEVEVEKELRHPRQGRDRGVRRQALHPEVHRLGVPLHGRVGEAHRQDRLLGRHRHGVRHLPQELRRERVVGPLGAAQEGPALPGAPRLLVVAAGRHGAQRRRGRLELQDRRRPERLRRLPAGGRARHRAARVDDDAVDPAVERVRGRARGLRVRGRRRPDGDPVPGLDEEARRREGARGRARRRS